MKTEYGKLYLIPSSIGSCDTGMEVPEGNAKIIASLDTFICENVRTARKFLRKTGYSKNFNEVTFFTLDKHTLSSDAESFIGPCLLGKDTGLLSESGTPCIADPGNVIVSMAHRNGIRLIPLSGPSSIILALMASGFNGQHFIFHGYLPVEKSSLIKKIREIEKNIYQYDQTQIFIEAPYRNNRLLSFIISACKASTLLCIASEIMSNNETITVKTIGGWAHGTHDFNKKNCVFLLYRQQ